MTHPDLHDLHQRARRYGFSLVVRNGRWELFEGERLSISSRSASVIDQVLDSHARRYAGERHEPI